MKVVNLFVCLLVLSASVSFANSEVDSATPGDGEIIAVVNYQGGFQQNLSSQALTKSIVKYFRVDVPSFCGGVEVLSAATVSEGVEDAAKMISKNVFQVAGGAGLRISAVSLTLNGPANASCSIPVFSRNSGNGGPVTGTQGVNQNVRFCNRYPRPLRMALAYQAETGMVSQGWYRILPGECVNVQTQSPLQNVVYSYAYSEQAIPQQWGTQQYFCVSQASPFLVTNQDCQVGTPGTQWQLFSAHPLNEKAILTVTYR